MVNRWISRIVLILLIVFVVYLLIGLVAYLGPVTVEHGPMVLVPER